MHYFSKTLRENNKKLWIIAAWSVGAVLAIADVFSYALGGSVFNLKFFYGFIIGNIVAVVALIIYKAVSEHIRRQYAGEEESIAAVFEQRREEEIRKKIAEDPGFVTLCYKCIHFNHDKLHCSRNMADEKLKEVRINEKSYCLYWIEAPQISI
jgi:hypothetical protein